jgi:hypothetical protein
LPFINTRSLIAASLQNFKNVIRTYSVAGAALDAFLLIDHNGQITLGIHVFTKRNGLLGAFRHAIAAAFASGDIGSVFFHSFLRR